MSNSGFGKTIESIKTIGTFNSIQQKKGDIISIWTKLPYNKVFWKNLKSIEMRKRTTTRIFMNKSVYLGLSKLGISKTAIHDYFLIT